MAIVRYYGVVLLKDGQPPMLVQAADGTIKRVNSFGCNGLAYEHSDAVVLLNAMRHINRDLRYELVVMAWEE